MSPGDTLPGIVLISLLLKLIFLAIVSYELLLSRLKSGWTSLGVTKNGPLGGTSGDGSRGETPGNGSRSETKGDGSRGETPGNGSRSETTGDRSRGEAGHEEPRIETGAHGPRSETMGDGPHTGTIDGGSEPSSSTIHWTTDLATEMAHTAVTGGAFLFCIGLLLGFDLMVRGDSWIPFPVTVALDLLILGLIIALLFSPKAYAVMPGGIVRQGSVLGWKDIGDAEDAGSGLKITTRAWYRENPRLPLPKDRELRIRIMDLVREYLRTR